MADSVIIVAGVTVTPGVGQNIVRWTSALGSCLPYLGLDKFEIWSAPSNDRAIATKVGEVFDVQFAHSGLLLGTTRWYWVRARDLSGNLGDFFPLSSTAGVSGTTISTGTDSVRNDELAPDSVDAENLRVNSVRAQHIMVDSLEAITATLGNVAINGSLVLNGTLVTAKAANEQWTAFRGGSNGGSIQCIAGVTQELVAAIMPSIGAPTLIVGTCALDGTSGFAAPYIQLSIYRDGTALKSLRLRADNANRDRPFAISVADLYPPAGNVRYSLRSYGIDGDSSNGTTRNHDIGCVQGYR